MRNMASPFSSRIQTNNEISSKMSGSNNKPDYVVLVSDGEWSDWETVTRSARTFDLIEINRKGVYQHWVMYLSKGYIVHVTQVDGRTEGDKAEKRVDLLQKIAGSDKCRINNLSHAAKAKGLEVRSEYEIYKSIEDVAGGGFELETLPQNHYKLMSYSVFSDNCEYYATGWKYGKGFSLQIETKIESFKRGEVPPEMIRASAIAANEELVEEPRQVGETSTTVVFKKKKKGAIGSIMPRN